MNSYSNPLVMVVEYLESTMSRELLGKFPDNSAFDFDYTQSSLWSPLIPRTFPSPPSPNGFIANGGLSSSALKRKLIFKEDTGAAAAADAAVALGKVTGCFGLKGKMGFGNAVVDSLHKYQKMMKKRKRKSFVDFSPVPSSNKKKGWGNVLKAASKHFKKKNKRRDSLGHRAETNVSSSPTEAYL